jgi:hypothetical protein
MTEHHDFRVLGCLAAAEQRQPAEDPDHDEVEQAKGHKPRSCRNRPIRPIRRSRHLQRVLKQYRYPWPLSRQVTAPRMTGYELPQLRKQRRGSFGAHGLLCRLATLPGERQTATRRVGHHSPAQFLIHHTASLTISSIRSKVVRPGANARTPRAAAQETSPPHPHHRHRRTRPHRLSSRPSATAASISKPAAAFPATSLRSLPPSASAWLQDVGEADS